MNKPIALSLFHTRRALAAFKSRHHDDKSGYFTCAQLILSLIVLFTLISTAPSHLYAADMRKASIIAEKALQEALRTKKENQFKIEKSRESLTKKKELLEQETGQLRQRAEMVENSIKALQEANETLKSETSGDEAAMEELAGAVRTAAANLNALLLSSMFTAWDSDRVDKLTPILNTKRFPGIEDMKIISDLFLEESRITGEIEYKKGTFISEKGKVVEGDILNLGGFTAAYRYGNQTGFLKYSEESRNFQALSALPSWSLRKALNRYMDGESDSVPTDISRGGALLEISHRLTLEEQIRQGGILVWPILGLGVLALLIALERTFFLGRVHANTDRIMGKVNELAALGSWEACDKMVQGEKKIPVYNVLRSGLGARKENRETLESILQEAILKELPKLERFLPILNIMGAIAPLLGLLGTVTGMISTFHVITLHGTGDPRMMSGGISTALVTTMLGLSVAIPIMLLYTFLCRRVEHVVGDMEEKAVALTNIIFREAR